MKKIFLWLAAASIFSSTILSYSETASVPRKLAVFTVFAGNLTEDEKNVLSQTLLVKISEIESIAVIEPMWKGAKELTYAEKKDRAVGLGADSYLAMIITGEKNRVQIKFMSFDILQNKIAIDEKTIERDRELRSLDRSFWLPVAAELSGSYRPISGDLVIKEITKHTGEENVIQEAKGVKVVIVAQPQTEITGLGKNKYIADNDGIVRLELPGASTYEMYATCPGFYPVQKQIYIANEPVRVELSQMPGSLFALDVYLQQADYIGAAFRYYYVSNKMFLDLKATLYFWKLIWPADGDKSKYEAPITHLGLLTGMYINSEDAILRFSVSAGIFLRLTYIDPVGVVLDPISGFGVTLVAVNMEISAFEKYRFFIEYSPSIYYTNNIALFKAALTGDGSGSNDKTAGYIFGDNAVYDLLDFRVGVRIQF